MTAGDIYTIAGNGKRAFSGEGGPAAKAQLSLPGGVALDGAGNLVVADTNNNNRVRVSAAAAGTFYGKTMTAGDIYTIAGNGLGVFSGDGGPATAAALAGPESIAVDGGGNLLIADTANNRVRPADVGAVQGPHLAAQHRATDSDPGRVGCWGEGVVGADACYEQVMFKGVQERRDRLALAGHDYRAVCALVDPTARRGQRCDSRL